MSATKSNGRRIIRVLARSSVNGSLRDGVRDIDRTDGSPDLDVSKRKVCFVEMMSSSAKSLWVD